VRSRGADRRRTAWQRGCLIGRNGVFVLDDEWISAEELERMANWNVDHTFEALGRPAPWKEKS